MYSPLVPFGHCSSSGRSESFPKTSQMSTVKSITWVLGGVDSVGDFTTCGPPREERSYFRLFIRIWLQSNVMDVARKGNVRKTGMMSVLDRICMVKEDKKDSKIIEGRPAQKWQQRDTE